jgi:hypothetical protein
VVANHVGQHFALPFPNELDTLRTGTYVFNLSANAWSVRIPLDESAVLALGRQKGLLVYKVFRSENRFFEKLLAAPSHRLREWWEHTQRPFEKRAWIDALYIYGMISVSHMWELITVLEKGCSILSRVTGSLFEIELRKAPTPRWCRNWQWRC